MPQNNQKFHQDEQFQKKKKNSLATCPVKTAGPISMVYGLKDADCSKEVPFGTLNEQLETVGVISPKNPKNGSE